MESPGTYAEISLSALSHNLGVVRSKTKDRAVLAVVKADSYGHGSVRVSRHLLKSGASMLGVAFTREAIELREAGIKAPILVFFDPEDPYTYLKYSLTPVVFDLRSAKLFSDAAYRRGKKISLHVKVDTGMGRVGTISSYALHEIIRISRLKNVRLEGIMSHFSDAELADQGFAVQQLDRFTGLIRALEEKNIVFRRHHISNSAAVLRLPKAHLDMVRPGIMLYGYGPGTRTGLKPVLSLKSRIIFLKTVPAGTPISYGRTFVTKRKSTIATVPAGYADGYSRKLSNNSEVLIKGKRAPVVGRVCMDTIMVDVTKIQGLQPGAEVVLIGRQGKEKITAQDIAARIGTIPYEVLTSIGRRIKRIYNY